ncbi:hypothetical protein ACFWXK_31090 [Streptomyces sp. NPDC059070]|uniref:hypothetical protein n=1 Tax=Streptomyces sp. NPDC059070 TaxID=3346713 RepID=UPI0036B0857C
MTNRTTERAARRTTRAARPSRRAAVLAPLLAFAVACGGSDDRADELPAAPGTPAAGTKGGAGQESPAAAGKGAFYDAQMKYVRCMRTKGGVKDFPDPKLSGYLDWAKIDAVTDPNGKGEEQKGGKNGACATELTDALKLEPPHDVQRDYESMLAHAKCMREKGVSSFKNPVVSDGNVMPGGEPDPASPRIDTRSPLYKQAREACKDELLDGLDGMQ